MRRLLSIACCLAVGALFAAEPDEAAFRAAMKQIGPTCSGLGKKIAAKDPTSSADAKKLADWFSKDVHKFWKAKKATDAETFAKTAAAEFKTIGKETGAAKWDEAGASFKKATATCGGCHGVHREKAADGSWTIK